MTEHSEQDQNETNEGAKPFAKKFIFPILLIACLFLVFSMLTKKSAGDGHADPHAEEHAVDSSDGHMEVEGEHHDHEHEHGHDHEHHDHEH